VGLAGRVGSGSRGCLGRERRERVNRALRGVWTRIWTINIYSHLCMRSQNMYNTEAEELSECCNPSNPI